jgi:hypothetical protein
MFTFKEAEKRSDKGIRLAHTTKSRNCVMALDKGSLKSNNASPGSQPQSIIEAPLPLSFVCGIARVYVPVLKRIIRAAHAYARLLCP